MTDTALGAAASNLPLFRVREVRDRREADAALSEDRAYAAYALADLEPDMFERAHFFLADDAARHAVVVHSSAAGRTMFVGGDPAGVDAILSLHPGPRAAYMTACTPAHVPAVERTYVISSRLDMQRMSVMRAGFSAVEGPLRRLRGADVYALNALYALGGGPAYYGERHLRNGVYFGAFEDGRLAAVAGTHVVAPNVGVAVVGNVFTHPAYRGQGLATRVTSRVTAELFDRGCALVVLTVDAQNAPAVQAYRRLGYSPGAAVVDAQVRRRDPLGLGALLRRGAARRRGRRLLGENIEQAPGRPVAGADGGSE